jgi:hypothetical protein
MNSNARRSKLHVAFVAGLAADRAKLAATKHTGTVGAACVGRLAAVLQSDADNLAIKVGENSVLEHALRHNGVHPDAQNGTELLPKYRRALDKLTGK